MFMRKGDNPNKITLHGFACCIAAGKNIEDRRKSHCTAPEGAVMKPGMRYVVETFWKALEIQPLISNTE